MTHICRPAPGSVSAAPCVAFEFFRATVSLAGILVLSGDQEMSSATFQARGSGQRQRLWGPSSLSPRPVFLPCHRRCLLAVSRRRPFGAQEWRAPGRGGSLGVQLPGRARIHPLGRNRGKNPSVPSPYWSALIFKMEISKKRGKCFLPSQERGEAAAHLGKKPSVFLRARVGLSVWR